MTDFATVDAGDGRELVAMMDATDAWPAVRAARAWVLDLASLDAGAVVLDAGCGPGTFGSAIAETGAAVVDVDASRTMLAEAQRRRVDTRVVRGDVSWLPVRDGVARLVRVERVLQWSADPVTVLSELFRVTAPRGCVAATDTDWGTLRVEHPDVAAADRLTQAALRSVPHPRFARDLPSTIAARGAKDVRARHDTVTITAWDPDDPAQHDGPPGLPLHSIAGVSTGDLDPVAARARARHFRAELTLVTVIGHV